jgi:hypothetical protein
VAVLAGPAPTVLQIAAPTQRRTPCRGTWYDGPSPEAIRRAAEVNQLPVDRITEVRFLDPYFYR